MSPAHTTGEDGQDNGQARVSRPLQQPRCHPLNSQPRLSAVVEDERLLLRPTDGGAARCVLRRIVTVDPRIVGRVMHRLNHVQVRMSRAIGFEPATGRHRLRESQTESGGSAAVRPAGHQLTTSLPSAFFARTATIGRACPACTSYGASFLVPVPLSAPEASSLMKVAVMAQGAFLRSANRRFLISGFAIPIIRLHLTE